MTDTTLAVQLGAIVIGRAHSWSDSYAGVSGSMPLTLRDALVSLMLSTNCPSDAKMREGIEREADRMVERVLEAARDLLT